ncbi:hypothetical protein [Campylobacter phage CP21]|uniref:Uncharacterized protein n=1 Tax=Campylobacter phage CP21 TaxID=2881391 RepID=I7IIA3_9CAUD|nr:hypothetical protein F421_gp246 [Campylobacter phage CP21]CCH63702.1 hypothetical protein [Campylobacter phage CP21]
MLKLVELMIDTQDNLQNVLTKALIVNIFLKVLNSQKNDNSYYRFEDRYDFDKRSIHNDIVISKMLD